jgi:hypothetical protein
MRYEARLTAYDVMDLVHVQVAIYGSGDQPGDPTGLLGTSTSTVLGTGESDPWQWARDALVSALENL